MQQAAALNELYRAAASKLNDGCRGVEGALRNATACQESLLAFDAGLRQLDDIGNVNNELFIRGRNIASRAVAYQMSVAILERTCEQAVMAHNRHRLVVASLLSLRCEAAARHLSLDRATLADNRRVVTRSMLMLGATVLPRHRIACAAADCHEASCALLLAAALDLCRLYGSGLRVALLGANAAARASVVQWACPGAMAHTVAGEDGGAVDVDASSRPSFSYFHLVHISQPASANGVHGWAPLRAHLTWGSRRLRPSGLLLCHGRACAPSDLGGSLPLELCADGVLNLTVAEAEGPSTGGSVAAEGGGASFDTAASAVAYRWPPVLPWGCRWLVHSAGARAEPVPEPAAEPAAEDDVGPLLILVNPPAEDEAPTKEHGHTPGEDEAAATTVASTGLTSGVTSGGVAPAGACRSGGGASSGALWPGLAEPTDQATLPWTAGTFVVSSEARRGRWRQLVGDVHPNVTLVPAAMASDLPAAQLDSAFETITRGVRNPPTDRRYAAHSTAVMLGHLAAWRAAAARRPALDFATILEDDARRTPAFGSPPLPDLVAELSAHDPEWDLLVLSALPPHRLSHILSDPSHAPELSAAELDAPPARATAHLMRIPPCTKAVAWVLSARYLRRLLTAQERDPYYGPVDVWAWRVRRAKENEDEDDEEERGVGGAVRAYAPLLPWVEEEEACASHHVPDRDEDHALSRDKVLSGEAARLL